MLRALILGGYGFFGARIAKALAADPRVNVATTSHARRSTRAATCVGLLSVEEYLAPLRELDVHEAPP